MEIAMFLSLFQRDSQFLDRFTIMEIEPGAKSGNSPFTQFEASLV